MSWFSNLCHSFGWGVLCAAIALTVGPYWAMTLAMVIVLLAALVIVVDQGLAERTNAGDEMFYMGSLLLAMLAAQWWSEGAHPTLISSAGGIALLIPLFYAFRAKVRGHRMPILVLWMFSIPALGLVLGPLASVLWHINTLSERIALRLRAST